MIEDPNNFRAISHFAQPGCRIYNDANITLTTATIAALTFNSERFDPFGMHSTSSNTSRITIVVPGTYIIGATVQFDTNSTGLRQVQIRLNDTSQIADYLLNASASGASRMAVVSLWDASPGDFFEVRAQQTSGGDLDVVSASASSPEFWAQRVG